VITQHSTLDATNVIIGVIIIFLSSILLTGIVRRFALKHAVMDEPNDRSSHSNPTPVGGGISISLCFLMGIILLAVCSIIPVNIAVALGGGGLLVSIVAWMDDYKNILPIWRGTFYLLAAVWALFWIDGFNSIDLGVYEIRNPYVLNLLAVLGITWMTNLFNFMDGTDGIAGVQASSTAFLSGVLFWISAQHGMAMLCFILMAASSGFLVWNWPPARIFMGDVGSCLIGFSFGTLALIGEKTDSVPILLWIIMLAVFICDATLTLFRRMLQKKSWYSAHKSHAYQRFVQLGASHKKLALWVLFTNVVILWPLALLAYNQKTLSIYMTLIAIILVTVTWLVIQSRFKDMKSTGN
jgi:Fuc2NAc and GlcNAc transferase